MNIVTTAFSITVEEQCCLIDTINNPIGGNVFLGTTDICKGSIKIGYMNNVTGNRTGFNGTRPPDKCGYPDTTFGKRTFTTSINLLQKNRHSNLHYVKLM